MGLPAEYQAKLKELVRREPVTLPDLGLEVVVRGLTGGEYTRIREHKRSDDMQIAITVELVAGQQLWNPNDLKDLDQIAELTVLDRAVIHEAGNRLSGMGKLEQFARRIASGNSDSPTPSGELSTS